MLGWCICGLNIGVTYLWPHTRRDEGGSWVQLMQLLAEISREAGLV